MRRAANGFVVEVVAPTLGLITRISPDEPDVRAATIASNVRFEKGVVKNAKGMITAGLVPVLDSPANLIFQTQFFLPSSNVGIVGTGRKIYTVRAPVLSSTLYLSQIYDFGAEIANIRNRILATSFFNKAIFAQPNSPLLYWDGVSAAAQLVRGLDPLLRWDGVTTFRSYVLIWRGSTLKWCASDDVFDWIPVGATATSAVLVTTRSFVIPAVGVETDWIYVDSDDAALLTIGQYMRLDVGDTTTYLTVTEVIPNAGQDNVVSGFSQTVPAGVQQNLFVSMFVPYTKDGQVYFKNTGAVLQVQNDAIDPGSLVITLAKDFVIPAIGGVVTVNVSATPPFALGTYVSVGFTTNPGSDIYMVQAVDLINNKMDLVYTGIGGTHSSSHITGEFIVAQPFVSVLNNGTAAAVSSFAEALLEINGFKGTVNDLTGVGAVGTVVPVGTEIFSVDANGAGELINAGSIINGPILQIDTLGDQAYILKNRSIQSIQYVGIDQGTFFIRPEITDEGLIGRYSYLKVGIDLMYIFGNREIYKYGGGSELTPVAQQHSVQVYAELDRTRADEIVGYHNEADFEIWFVYPIISEDPEDFPYRVFIYNYKEDSCTIDDYDSSVHPDLVLHGISALGRLDLSANPSWQFSTGTWIAPGSWRADATWQELQSSAAENFTVAGFKKDESQNLPTLALLNQGYDRDGHDMLCQYESADFSAGDSIAIKYADTVYFGLQALALASSINPYVITVQIGSRMGLDDDLVWSNPVLFQVQPGKQMYPKVNIQRTGRFLRLRINSSQKGCGWRISRMVLMGRMGSTY